MKYYSLQVRIRNLGYQKHIEELEESLCVHRREQVVGRAASGWGIIKRLKTLQSFEMIMGRPVDRADDYYKIAVKDSLLPQSYPWQIYHSSELQFYSREIKFPKKGDVILKPEYDFKCEKFANSGLLHRTSPRTGGKKDFLMIFGKYLVADDLSVYHYREAFFRTGNRIMEWFNDIYV